MESPIYGWVQDHLAAAEAAIKFKLVGAELLGGGMSGQAFRPAGKPVAIKITRSTREARAVAAVLDMRRNGHALDGFVAMPYKDPVEIGTARIDYGRTDTIWVLVKHLVTPLDAEALPLPKHTWTRRGAFPQTGNALALAAEAALAWSREKRTGHKRQLLAEYDYWLKTAARDEPRLAKVVESVAALAEEYGPVYDAVRGNMGLDRAGKIVCFDWEFAASE